MPHTHNLISSVAVADPHLLSTCVYKVAYAAAMGRAASGAYSTNLAKECDGSLFDNLNYPQASLTPTAWATESYAHELPTTQNAVVAILSCGGANQEDAIIISKAALDRGMFRSTRYRTFRDQESTDKSETKTYQAQQHHRFDGDMESIALGVVDKDGLVSPGTKVEEGDILMHKTVETKKTAIVWKHADGSDIQKPVKKAAAPKAKRAAAKKADSSPAAPKDEAKDEAKDERAKPAAPAKRTRKAKPQEAAEPAEPLLVDDLAPGAVTGCASEEPLATAQLVKTYGHVIDSSVKVDPSNALNAVKFHDPAVVDRVMVTQTETGDKLTKVRLRSDRRPQVGDKFATQAPQKGVIGEERNQEDMPWTEEGIVPDIILVSRQGLASHRATPRRC